MSTKSIFIVALLLELGNCCISQEKSLLLTQDCLDFLKSIDHLDQYVGVPNTIDENMYKVICKHRRLRIDNELKIKANSIEQSDVEIAIGAYQKYLILKKELDTKLVNSLQDIRQEKLEFIHDKTMQIVIRRGLVEIPVSGSISDYENAILIHRKDVEAINAIILKAGAAKLKVMNDKMVHRRGIIMKEWEHKKMKMEIEDLNNHLYFIEHIKVTKEIQQYLRQKAKGEAYDKGTLTLDQEIESKKKSYEKVLEERQMAIQELDRQIKDYKKKNRMLDKQIAEINVDVCEKQESRDRVFERQHEQDLKNRMAAIIKRSNLVKQIQEQHNEILVLQTELELLRLKTYPTLKFKTLF